MTVTEKQLIVLLQTAAESLRIAGSGIFSFDERSRREVVTAVTNQQNATLTATPEKGQPNA